MTRIFFVVLLFEIFSACVSHERVDIGGKYFYKVPRTKLDSINYMLPVDDIPMDSVSVGNSRIFMEAFDESNISLKGADTPIIRLVVSVRHKKSMIIRITGDRLIRKVYQSGAYYPELNLELLTEQEKKDFNSLEYNLGLKSRVLPEHFKRWYDSVTAVNPTLKSQSYYDELVQKATVSDKLKYKTDTFVITRSTLNDLYRKIKASGCLQLPPFDSTPCFDSHDNGGFYLEVNSPQKYSIVQQTYGCKKRAGFAELYTYLVALAKLKDEYSLD
jgi:hypothetical protein